MISYFLPFETDDGLTLSVDKIVLDYRIPSALTRDALVRFIDQLPDQFNTDVTTYESLKIGVFHSNARIVLNDGSSFFLGIGLNAEKTRWDQCRLEFNPNKVAHHQVLLCVLGWLNDHTIFIRRTVKRFDLAIDIPVDRQDAMLVKDRRVYQERRHGEERTEYLGAKSSTVGHCKLYNKSVEANLSYPLTRLEVTLDPATPYGELPLPKVYYINATQIQLDEKLGLSDTQHYILDAYLNGYGHLDLLGRRTREKIERCLDLYCKQASISKLDYTRIRAQLSAYLNFPNTELIPFPTELDQGPSLPLIA